MKEYILTCKIEAEKSKTPVGYWLIDGVKEEDIEIPFLDDKEINEKIQNSD